MPAYQNPDELGTPPSSPGLLAAAGPALPGFGEGSSAGRLEAEQVQVMFDGIAGVYDALNGAMTAGLHHRWRTRAVDFARVGPGSRVLDVATGTGDLALELARRVAPGGTVVGSDFSEGMLARARSKAQAGGIPEASEGTAAAGGSAQGVSLRFEWGDALELPYPNDSFDAATVGFGARNFSDLGRGLREMVRVVRPGGRVVVLELTTPTGSPLSLFYRVWFDRVVPQLGRLVGALPGNRRGAGVEGAAGAYTYLPNSVKRFPAPPALAAELEQVGLCEIAYLLTAGGIIAIHAGTVPRQTAPAPQTPPGIFAANGG